MSFIWWCCCSLVDCRLYQVLFFLFFFFFKQKTAYEMRISDWSSDVCSSDLLKPAPADSAREKINEDALEQNARMLESVLNEFGVQGEITKVRPGPVVTLYELEPAPGTKSSRVIGLSDDIARSISALSASVAVIPGRTANGTDLPTATRPTAHLPAPRASAHS